MSRVSPWGSLAKGPSWEAVARSKRVFAHGLQWIRSKETAQEVTADALDSDSIGGPNGWCGIDGGSDMAKRGEKLDPLVGEKALLLEQAESFVPVT
jgi:hypothetical protein